MPSGREDMIHVCIVRASQWISYPSTSLLSADAHNRIPAVRVKCLTQDPLLPLAIDLPLNGASAADVSCVFNHKRPRDLDVMGLVVVASVDADVPLAAVAEAPASARFVTKG